MARPRENEAVDLAVPHELTDTLILRVRCPDGLQQAFLRDSISRGLAVRLTPVDSTLTKRLPKRGKSFVFESKVKGSTFRRTIGRVEDLSLNDARKAAAKLRALILDGLDPREEDKKAAAREAEQAAAVEAAMRATEQREREQSITVADVWPRYMAEGKPQRKDAWKPRYRADMEKAVSLGGIAKKRGEGVTKPGHLASLLPLRLVEIDQDRMRDWFNIESKRSPRQAVRSAAMFSGFLRWCSRQPDLRSMVQARAASSDALGDLLPAKVIRTDAIAREQLPAWFAATDKLRNTVARAYLQGLLLTGARREELASLKWEDIDFRWRRVTIADKVGDRRIVPLAPYFATLVSALPRATFKDGTPNPYVFAARSQSGRIAEPRGAHEDVLRDAGIGHVSIHGLRRSFAKLGEQAGAPEGAIAQVMGHRPSAVASGYKVRSVDELRPHLERIEAWILEQAGIPFIADAEPGKLVRVK